MKKIVLLLIAAFFVTSVYAETGKNRLYFTLSPALGHYHYWVLDDGERYIEYDGGLNQLSANFEYNVYSFINLFAFAEFTGHLYDGHEDSSFFLNVIWGLTHIKAGLGASLAFDIGKITASVAAGVNFMLYIDDWDESYTGIGIKAQANIVYNITDNFFAGISFNLNNTIHDAEYPRIPFEILEYGVGITGGFKL
jgi:hypothetical protein